MLHEDLITVAKCYHLFLFFLFLPFSPVVLTDVHRHNTFLFQISI